MERMGCTLANLFELESSWHSFDIVCHTLISNHVTDITTEITVSIHPLFHKELADYYVISLSTDVRDVFDRNMITFEKEFFIGKFAKYRLLIVQVFWLNQSSTKIISYSPNALLTFERKSKLFTSRFILRLLSEEKVELEEEELSQKKISSK